MFMTLLRHLAWFVTYVLLGASVAVVFIYSMRLDAIPDLSVWHTVRLESEFRESSAATVRTIADYRALETRLFAELRNKVIDKVEQQDQPSVNRYAAGSRADPLTQPVNWNRTFELTTPNSRGSVLMVHGLTDSPYVMRALGERLNKRGFHVVGLRLPGHGTTPAGLTDVHWRDFAAALRMAARDLVQKSANKPLYMIGFSTGAALSVEYALARAQGEDLPAVSRMVLMSPAIGVSPAAALAVWQKRAGRLLGIEKLEWADVQPEYDPYKYNSFAVNAGEQVYEITRVIAKRQAAFSGAPAPKDFPSVLAFQSVADTTVSAPAVIHALSGALTPGKHELVLFDINRHANVTGLYQRNTPEHKQLLLNGPHLPFELTILANKDSESTLLTEIRRNSITGAITEHPLDLVWPASIFSLSHVALPISPDDPVYGSQRPKTGGRIYLGTIQVLGEGGLLAVPPASLMRLRYNPFFEYMAERIERFLDVQ